MTADDTQAQALFEPGEPVFFVINISAHSLKALRDTLSLQNATAVIRLLNGSKCRTTFAFFAEIARELDFPSDRVGWNILNERMFDLNWLPGRSYLLMIGDADQFLADEKIFELMNWQQIMTSIAAFSTTNSQGNLLTPRKILLQCEPDKLAELIARWEAAGSTPEYIKL